MPHDDHHDMTCERTREAISAMIDGEDPGMDLRIVEAHMRSCVDCRAFRSLAKQTRGFGAVGPAPEMPDLSRRVSKLAAISDRASAWWLARATLAIVALEIAAFAIWDLLGRSAEGANAHESRHLGAFSISYAVALLVVVVRPARARTVLPVAAVLAGALAVTAILDLVNGSVPLLGEALHLPEILSVGLVCALAAPTRRPRPRAQAGARPLLQVVDAADRQAS